MTIKKLKENLIIFKKDLVKITNDNEKRSIITKFMFFLEENHFIQKNYLDYNYIFVKSESNQEKIKDLEPEVLLSFLTMIYRIDYISPNSDALLIYFRNKMLYNIVDSLIDKLP